ncbi:hypothetical protein JKF63_05978 [Porcisia hertigi]|uniref:ATPase AAA-type core domain-containing protein n=1 Tax=Porcisia hertigi TaxID=2761500 RepID=A0A836IKG4_9TRYP|nr:hypothetical protein JKF63_05978 [Porcisia hertigi]
MVGRPRRARHDPARTSLSVTTKDRKPIGVKRIIDRPTSATGQLYSKGHSCPSSLGSTASSAHTSSVITVDDNDEETATAHGDATRKVDAGLVFDSVNRSTTGSTDPNLPPHRTVGSAETVVEEVVDIQPTSTSSFTLDPRLSTVATPATDPGVLDDGVALTLGSQPLARKEKGCSRDHCKGSEGKEGARQDVTYLSDEESIGELQPHHERPTAPPQSSTSVKCSSGNTRFSHACEPMMLSQPLHEESDKGESGDVEALAAPQPDPQRGEARSVHRTTCCFSSLGPTATEESLQHTGTRTYPDKVTVLHSLHTAPILHVSGLIDFFTYGIQAAMRHYSGHLNITTSAEDDGACGEMSGRAHTLLPDRETTCTAPPASPDGTLHWSTPPPYRNTFLEDSADESKCGATWAHCRDRAVSCSSSSSSSAAATYDSDVEGNGSVPLKDDKKPERREGCLLNPQHTSLFRPPRGATAARDPAERGTTVDGSWLATTEPTPSSTHSQKPLQVPGGSEQVVHQQRDNTAHVLFGEALQHAYQCEDAHRHLRRARLDKHREQLLRGVALLQGGPPSLCAALLGEMQSFYGHGGLCGTGSATSPTTPQQERRPVGASSLSRFATRVGAAPKRSTETMAQWASKAQEALPVPVQQDGGANKDTTEALFTGSGEAWFSSSPMTTATPPMGSIPKHLLQVMPPAQAQRLRRPLNSFTEALLRHHRDSVMKQCAARQAEDQTIRARRIYEFPLLTQDVVRYASLLVCLRRRSSSGDGTAVSSAAASAGEPVGLLADSSNKESSSSASNGESPQSPTVAAAEPAASHSFGEEGTLLYLKYPAPLLRTTSFAVETVRLLKWLRTWKKSSLAASSGTGGTSGCASRGSTGNVSGCGSDNSSRISGKNGRKRVRVVVASPAPCAASSSSRTPTTTAEASLPNRSTVEYVCRQAPHAVDLHEAGVRQERRTAFLKLFGAAAVQAQADTPSPTTPAGSNATAMHKKKDGSADAKEVVVQKLASCSAVSELSSRSAGVRHTSSTPVGATQGIDSPLGPLSPTSGRTQLKPSQLMRGSRAYQLYCHAWKHVVKSGITPISVAANVFSGSHAITGPPCLINPHDDNTGTAATSDKDTSWTNGTVSRVCAALPFFKEMREEARHTALGSAHNGSYYEDAFGNRLRSARLAKKEQEQRELLAARQRRRAKKKGYFHRDDDDTKNGGLSGRAADQRASGLLEAMLQSFATCGSEGLDAGRRRKRRRSADSSDDGSESEDTAKGAGPRSSKECAALPCSSSPESSSRSSSSSSSALTVSTEYDQDNEIAKDELTNIAVVSGPTGSGKTAAVYMAAQLLGFRVVEMNTSVRRCPKTVEHLLAELTRSYRLSGPRSGAAGGFNVEEELAKLKQQHAAMMKQAKARASAAEKETLLTKRGAVKGNHISAQAIEKFFSKGSGRAAVPSRETAGCNQKKDVAEQEPGVCIVDETHAPAAISTPSSPLPSLPQQQPAATPGAPTGTDTLLLFEDADILLGDESAKSFYAAIRDLAHRSKVPIVVTVSSDPAPAQRYDTEPFLALLDQQLQPQQPRIVSTSLGSALQPTYWHLCNAAGINSTMAALDAEQQALQVETDSSNYAALTEIAVTTTAATRESGGTPSTVSDPGKNMSRSPASGTFAAALPTPFPYVGSGGGAGGSAAPATGSGTNGVVTGASQPVAPGGSGSTNTTAASAAARYTHMLLNATLVSNFFGSQTPFTVVGPLPPSALYAQLLAVGAVELDLLRFNGPTALSDDGDGAATLPSSSWQQELECMAAGLTVRDVGLFLRLAEQLRQHIFGAWNVVSDTTSASPPSSPSARQGLVSAVQCDAAHSTTTDIRYWLNKLQVLLLSLRTESDAAQVVELAEDELLPGAATRKRSQATISKTSSAALSAVYSGDDVTSDTHLIGARRAEHLLEADFQSRASLAASEWDSAHGRHLSNVTYNELHSTRYQHWFLDNHVHYIADIVEELATTDHLTTHVDYTTPPKVPTSPVAAAKTLRRGRSPTSLSSKQRYPCAKDSDITTAAIPEPAQRQQEVASACLTKSSNNGGGGGAGSGMHPAWRSFFVASGASRTSTSSTASPTLRDALQENTRQQTLVGRGDFKAYRTALDAPPPPSLAIPSRYEWPPSVQELRKQARSQADLRPVELLLPYGAAGDYYSTTAKSASTLAPLSIHDPAEQTSALLGHQTSLRCPMRCAKRESSAGDNGEEEGDVGRDLPTGALSTQEDRFNVFRRWWCRARKAGVLRDSVAGHPVGALEDLIGFGCLLTSSAASTRTATA